MPSLPELLRRPVPRRVHGGLVEDELVALGVDPATVLDVSTSVNPYGPTPSMVRAVREARLELYPDPTAAASRAAIAASAGTTPDRVVLGNGATDLLWTLARLLLAPGETLLVCEPSFSELRVAAEAGGARVVAWRAQASDGFVLDVDRVARSARLERASAVALCAPGSPSGAATPVADVARLARTLGERALIVDQSFLALSERHAELSMRLPANVVCVRSLTKEHAIAGVRVGYAVAEPPLAERIEASRAAWTVGAAAQAAAIAAARDDGFVAASRERLLGERARLADALAERGFRTLPSTTPYFLVEVGDAAAFRARLVTEHGILVRDCASFGLPAFVRLAARGGPDAQRIAGAFAALGRDAARCPGA
ncbi:MAG: aminotransferase class I/II-fold pyridoxal phosphate-dependent enzyme [Thermodesulfobacteriota bacterium]